MAIDKNKILAGRKAVDAYHEAHSALHAKPWHRGVPEEHTPLVNAMMTELKAQGFNSVAEFNAADKEFRAIEYGDELRVLTLPAGNPVRIVDISSLGLEESWLSGVGAKRLRLDNVIPDTVYFRCSPSTAMPTVTCADTPEGDELARRVTPLGVEVLRGWCRRSGRFIWHHDFTLRTITKDRFAALAEAKKASCALCVRTLTALGVQEVAVSGNNFTVNERKVATFQDSSGLSGVSSAIINPSEVGNVFSMVSLVTLDFDYDLGQQIFPGQDIRGGVTTLKEVLGHDVDPQALKDAALAAVRAVFNSPVSEDSLGQAELDVIAGLRLNGH